MMLQNLCRLNCSWDDDIPQVYQSQWAKWQEDLKKLGTFRVARCLKPKGFGQVVSARLHHFSDACENGYGTVSYLRLQDDSEQIHLSFILGKARVAPLKKVTIPRLELTAAVLAVRIDRLLKAELQLKLENSTFWTDSTPVLKYIQNETKRFHTFVANRISFIREATAISQWRYIDTRQNPADEASRGVNVEYLLSHSRWIYGPDFLFKNESNWPSSAANSPFISNDDPEVKKEATVNTVVSKSSQNATDQLITYFSSWKRLKMAAVCFLQTLQGKAW
ncbi:uncharacterized protein LOC115796980 [Archocentrus centrarchus]|uniref:uncharacterized protein LOC115796980 n=1 Tax=Archocentrus centrarchus TaxID=63155 RepID=UPI0011E9FCB2|nr:uncharacterized protein LOC115796980 [Archocentrus centrarchus]